MKVVRQRKKKYEIVADRLKECIQEGVYTHKLPGVRILAEELETNPMTLGTAIKILVSEGLLYRVPRSGTYVQKDDSAQKSVIALVVSDVQAPITSFALARIGQFAAEKKVSLLYFSHGNDPKEEEAILRTLAKDKTASGIIWWPSSALSGLRNQELLVESELPFVALEMTWRGILGGCVLTDYYAGFRDLTKHMIEQGYRRVLFVTDLASCETDPRYLAYRSTLEANGLPYFPPYELKTNWLANAGASEEAKPVVENLKSYDALICLHDRFGAQVYQFLLRQSVFCPRDVALASFDGLEVAELLGLTSFSQPMGEIGESALEILVESMENPETTPRRVFLEGKLLPRASSGLVADYESRNISS